MPLPVTPLRVLLTTHFQSSIGNFIRHSSRGTTLCRLARRRSAGSLAIICSRSNACSDWPILGHYSPVMPTGRLRACKSQAKQQIQKQQQKKKKKGKKSLYAVSRYAVTPLPVTPLRGLLTTLKV